MLNRYARSTFTRIFTPPARLLLLSSGFVLFLAAYVSR